METPVETEAQPEDSELAKKPAHKGKGKKGAIATEDESQSTGTPLLLLIHDPTVSREDYAPVLPRLAETFHAYAADCYGHGGSNKDPGLYTAKTNGEALAWFIRNVIGQPAIVSGHSSCGLLAAWLAAYAQDTMRVVVLAQWIQACQRFR